MQYDDEQILNLKDYEAMAKAYAQSLREKGFRIVQMEDSYVSGLAQDVLKSMIKIKSCLFSLGGFLNTSSFYSLNERQIKKFSLLFDCDQTFSGFRPPYDKTKCLLIFLAEECLLVKNLIQLAENCNFESQIKDMAYARLNKLNEILSIDD